MDAIVNVYINDMPFPVDSKGRFIVHRGPRGSVVCAVKENGNSPAKEFIEKLERTDIATLQKFAPLFQRICQDGRISNKEHFRHEEGDIWSFKRHQHRLPCFRDGNDFVLTHGLVKKSNKWRKSDLQVAVAVMADDRKRVNKLRSKGQKA